MSNTLSADVLEAAATWYVDLQSANNEAPVRQAHTQWLDQHPSHRKAWARVEKLQETIEPAQGSAASETLSNARISRRQSIKILSALLVAGVGASAWQQKETVQGLVAEYRTGTGESRELKLADGGVLHLNTATSIDVNYSDSLREITLYSGEIQIVTAQDPLNRPFIVRTPHGSIRALGTHFLVRSDGDQTCVSVLAHAVEVQQKATAQKIRVEANQKLCFSAEKIASIQSLQHDANAWVKGLLVVSDWRLDKFLTELSRYHSGRISCDESIASLHISGSFHLANIQTVLENLSVTLPIKVRYFTRYWIRVESS